MSKKELLGLFFNVSLWKDCMAVIFILCFWGGGHQPNKQTPNKTKQQQTKKNTRGELKFQSDVKNKDDFCMYLQYQKDILKSNLLRDWEKYYLKKV